MAFLVQVKDFIWPSYGYTILAAYLQTALT